MQTKRKIAVDIDDVSLACIPSLRLFYNKIFVMDIKLEDYFSYDLEKVWHCTKKEAIEIVNNFYKSREFKQMLPVKGAQTAIKILSKSNELIALTSRPSFIEKETKESLSKYFGNAFSGFFFNGQYHLSSSFLNKADYCSKNEISVILEDNLDIAKKCAEKGITVFLFDNLWNKNSSDISANLIRVGENKNPWEEVLEHLV